MHKWFKDSVPDLKNVSHSLLSCCYHVLLSFFLLSSSHCLILCYHVIIMFFCHSFCYLVLIISFSIILFLISCSLLFLCCCLCHLVSCDHVAITNSTSCCCFYSSGSWVPYPSRSAEGKWAQKVLARSSICSYPACFLSSSTQPKKSSEVMAQFGMLRFCLPPEKETKWISALKWTSSYYFLWSLIMILGHRPKLPLYFSCCTFSTYLRQTCQRLCL